MEERLVSPQKQPEDEQGLNAPVNLRPNSLADFVGQKQVCENLKVFIEAAKNAAKRWIMYCCSVLRDWAKRRWRRLWRKSLGSVSGRLRRR